MNAPEKKEDRTLNPSAPTAFSRGARREVARFFGIPGAGIKRESRQPVPIADLLNVVIEEHRIGKPGFHQTLMENWASVVGGGNSHRCRPLRIAEPATLVIAVPNPTFRQEMAFQKDYVLRAIQRLPGGNKIRDLRFISG